MLGPHATHRTKQTQAHQHNKGHALVLPPPPICLVCLCALPPRSSSQCPKGPSFIVPYHPPTPHHTTHTHTALAKLPLAAPPLSPTRSVLAERSMEVKTVARKSLFEWKDLHETYKRQEDTLPTAVLTALTGR